MLASGFDMLCLTLIPQIHGHARVRRSFRAHERNFCQRVTRSATLVLLLMQLPARHQVLPQCT